jgi:predicted RNA-binding Zn ribbon-like protein
MRQPRTPETIPLWGERLCLDYANTVDWSQESGHVDPEQTDVLRTAGMLAAWGRRLGLLDGDPETAGAAELERARALRDTVYRIFCAITREQVPAPKDIDALATDFREAVGHATLLAAESSFELDWPAAGSRRVRYAVVTDAVALLQDSERLERVRRCPGRNCGWLFLNTSGRRRWCSMSTCGSREKMRRLHQRRTQPDPAAR